MKVFDLQCALQHVFEGWFASEEEFQRQLGASMVVCPLCGNASVSKRLSAPRLNLRHAARQSSTGQDVETSDVTGGAPSLQNTWMALASHVVATTVDVGGDFADEARRIHYGETPERAIRGTTTVAEAIQLLDEGIAVLPVLLPETFKKTLQ